MPTQAVEDYLKIIYELQTENGKVNTSILAERLQVVPASVTGMIKKLDDMRLVSYKPYRGVTLTKAGKKIALEVIRHHRLVELYLAEALGVPWDQVHAEAEKWEHILSEDLEERMDAALGYPTSDPHGAPIPTRQGKIDVSPRTALTNLKAKQPAVIAEVSDHDPALLRYLGSLNLYPNTPIELVTIAPFDGPLTIRVGGIEHVLGRKVASHILVTETKKSRD